LENDFKKLEEYFKKAKSEQNISSQNNQELAVYPRRED
jgi:hypothetical protein